jgi:hypothetical protein
MKGQRGGPENFDSDCGTDKGTLAARMEGLNPDDPKGFRKAALDAPAHQHTSSVT